MGLPLVGRDSDWLSGTQVCTQNHEAVRLDQASLGSGFGGSHVMVLMDTMLDKSGSIERWVRAGTGPR